MGNKQDKREVSKDKQPSGTDQEQPQTLGGLPEDVTSHVLDFLDLPDQARYAGVNKAGYSLIKRAEEAVKARFRIDAPGSVAGLERLEKLGVKINWKLEYKLYLQRNFNFELLEKIRPRFNLSSAQIKLIPQLFSLAKAADLEGIRKIMPQIDRAMLLFPDARGMTVISWINKNKAKAKADSATPEIYNIILQELYQHVQYLQFMQDRVEEYACFYRSSDSYGLSLFEWAVYLGQLEVCTEHAEGREINLLREDVGGGAQALFLAITSCNTLMVRYLLETLHIQTNIDHYRLDYYLPKYWNLAANVVLVKF